MAVVENISIDVKTNAGSAASQFRSLSSALAGVRNAGRSVASGGSGKAILSLGNHAKSATGAMGKLFSSIKRIAMYRLLRSALKEIGQAFQEGLKNAYNFSKGIDGSLAKAMDGLATKSQTMKNQLGAAFGNLLQIIMPVLLQIIDLVTRAASAISALFSMLGGGQYLVAKDVATGWDKATGAAKKYKNTILGFDEINRLNDETGGGGGSAVNASDMFEVGELPAELQSIVDTVKSLIDHENFDTLGQYLAEKLNQAIKGINLWSIAETLGTKINNALTTVNGFLKRLDVRGIAENIFAAISHGINQIDFHTVGEIIARQFTMLGDILLGALYGIDWEGLGKAVGDLFRGIFDHLSEWFDSVDWDDAGRQLFKAIKKFIIGIDFDSLATSFWTALKKAINGAGKFASGFLDEATKWMNETDFIELGYKFYNNLKSALEGIDFASIAESVFKFLGAAIASALQFVWPFIKEAALGIFNYFNQFIVIDENDDWFQIGMKIIGGILEGVAQALVDIWSWIMDNVVHPLIKGFCDAFGIKSPSTVMRDEVGKYIGSGLLEGIVHPFKDIYNWIKTNIFDPFVSGFKSAFGMEGDGESVTFKNLGEKIVDGLSAGFKATWDTFVSNVKTWWENLKTWFEGLSLNLSVKGTTVNENGFSNASGKFAAEGGMFPNTGTLIWAGEAGPEIVANVGNSTGVMNVNQMEAAVASGNMNVVNAIYGMANMIVKAVESIDTDVTLDGESLADKMYYYNQNAATRHGAAMVT